MAKYHLINKSQQRRWSLAIKDRDQWRCTQCGKEWGRLEAHHIKRFGDERDWLLSNGLTLCRDCHIKLHRKRWKDSLDDETRDWENLIDQLRGKKL